MMKKYILLVLFSIILANAHSQVKIGNTDAPHSFSTLEIETTHGGVRLSQLTNAERNQVSTVIENSDNPALAGGLVIYNTTSKQIEMWRDASDKWIALSMGGACTAPTNITIKSHSPLTLNEYGTEDLHLEAMPTGQSENADLYYEWFRNDMQVGTGKNYKVSKKRLSFRDAGSYKVRVLSCSGKVVAQELESTPVTIVINE